MSPNTKPQKLVFTFKDYLKVFWAWMRLFKRTYSIEPGLYFYGDEYDSESPLLVTCNFHLTVFWLCKKLKHKVRVLVIDTNGINVWCASSEGVFSAENIIKQLKIHFVNIKNIKIILPKLCLSGVSLAKLRKNRVIPRIGPVYASRLNDYLDHYPSLKTLNDRFEFSFKDRLFSLPPSIIQFSKYLILMGLVFFVIHIFLNTGIYWQIIPLGLTFAAFYIILFPLLPTTFFVLKGLFLYFTVWIPAGLYLVVRHPTSLSLESCLFYLFFTAGLAVIFSLYYTGNSGVSSYSLVKKEIIWFLPVSAILFLLSVIILIFKGL